MEQKYITEFEKKFNISFTDITNINDLGVIWSYDDGLYHYINTINEEVYTFDSDEECWLEKNANRTDVLNMLNDKHSMLDILSPIIESLKKTQTNQLKERT